MDSKQRGEAAASGTARPGGLAIGEAYSHDDGFTIRVDRLGVLPRVPPKTIFDEDEDYVAAEAVRFEVTVTNEGDKAGDLSELTIRVRSGPEGRPGEETWKGTKVLRGKLLPGASATGTYSYRVLSGTTGEIDISVTRGRYSSDDGTEQVWTGAAVPGLHEAVEPGEGLSQDQRARLLAGAVRELDEMPGLHAARKRVRVLTAQARMSALRARLELPVVTSAHHLVFAGPPGSGKTSVARLLAKMLAGLGVLEKGHLVEAHRPDLIGGHLGETAIKTNKLIDSALGGVLFIDEAYSLHGGLGGNSDAFCDEAIQVLLKRAEDDRHRLVVVLAGYGREMTRLLGSNPGLASRFAIRLDFPSYSAGELLAIARGMLAASADRPQEKADAELRRICKAVEANGWADQLGNGRFVRTLLEGARALRDLRLDEEHPGHDPSAELLTTLTAADLKAAFADVKAGFRLRPGAVPDGDGRVRAAA